MVGWCLRSGISVSLSHVVLASPLSFPLFFKIWALPSSWNIGTLFSLICQVKFTQMSQKLQQKKINLGFFPTAGSKGINSYWMSKDHKKSGRVFPELLGTGQVVIVVEIFHVFMRTQKQSTKQNKQNKRLMVMHSCFFFCPFLSANLQSGRQTNFQCWDCLIIFRLLYVNASQVSENISIICI